MEAAQKKRGRRQRARDAHGKQGQQPPGANVSMPAPSRCQFQKKTSARDPTCHVLEPGLVLIRNAMDPETQQWLVSRCMEIGDGTFYEVTPGALPRLNQGNRGRLIDAISAFPERFTELCMQYVTAVSGVEGW